LTRASARKIGQRALKMTNKAKNGVIIKDVSSSPNIHPGDAITYQSLSQRHQQVVISTKQDLVNKVSDVSINAVDASLEDILQRFQEVDISNSYDSNFDRNRQYSVEEFSTSVGYKLKLSWEIRERIDENNGIGTIIGDSRRNIIHGLTNYMATSNFSTADYVVNYMNAAPVVGTKLKVKAGGASYGSSATYTNLATTGGTGSGLKVNITTVDNVITEAVVHTAGSSYALGDVVTVVKSGGSGGQLLLTSTIIVDNGSGGAVSSAIAVGSNVYRENGGLVGTVACSTTSSVTFESGLNYTIDNNEHLLIDATVGVPEANNSRAVIGAVSSKYLVQRRG